MVFGCMALFCRVLLCTWLRWVDMRPLALADICEYVLAHANPMKMQQRDIELFAHATYLAFSSLCNGEMKPCCLLCMCWAVGFLCANRFLLRHSGWSGGAIVEHHALLKRGLMFFTE